MIKYHALIFAVSNSCKVVALNFMEYESTGWRRITNTYWFLFIQQLLLNQ